MSEAPTRLLIGGEWLPAGETFPTVDPSTGQTITNVAAASESDVDSAVAAARTARRLRADHAVELPADDRGVEARARARHRQCRDPQAGRADAAHRDPARRAVRGGRFPAGDREPADRGPGGRPAPGRPPGRR